MVAMWRGVAARVAAGFALACVLVVAGCSESAKPEYSVCKVGIPKLGAEAGAVGQPARVGGQVTQNVRFAKTPPSVADNYAAWFKKQKWSTLSESADVNASSYRFSQGGAIATVGYRSGDGVFVEVSRPEKDYQAAPEPQLN